MQRSPHEDAPKPVLHFYDENGACILTRSQLKRIAKLHPGSIEACGMLTEAYAGSTLRRAYENAASAAQYMAKILHGADLIVIRKKRLLTASNLASFLRGGEFECTVTAEMYRSTDSISRYMRARDGKIAITGYPADLNSLRER